MARCCASTTTCTGGRFRRARQNTLLRDRAHDARGRAGIAATARPLHQLEDLLVVGGERRHRELRLHNSARLWAAFFLVRQ